LKLQSVHVSRQHLLTEWPYKWVKIIKDCTGWNFRMWPLAVSLGCQAPYKKMYRCFAGTKKVPTIITWPYQWDDCKAMFHCNGRLVRQKFAMSDWNGLTGTFWNSAWEKSLKNCFNNLLCPLNYEAAVVWHLLWALNFCRF